MTVNAAPIPASSLAGDDIITGDCREAMPAHGPFDMILADPPYGDNSLAWDRRVEGWLPLARALLKSSSSPWVFGSLCSFMATAGEACRLSGCRSLGCEIDADMAEKARARIAAVLPLGRGSPA